MKRHTTQQKAHNPTQWQINKLKKMTAELISSPEYIALLEKFKNKAKEELML